MTFRQLLVRSFFKAIRLVLRGLTFLRCPALLKDPSALVTQLFEEFETEQVLSRREDSKVSNRPMPLPGKKHSVLVVIPHKDKVHLTLKALDSLALQTVCQSEVDVLLVDNGSSAKTKARIQKWIDEYTPKEGLVKLQMSTLILDVPFNYSYLNNEGVRHATQSRSFDYCLFLNNDIELLDPSSLSRLLIFSEGLGDRMGAVGCTLLYPNGRVQHSFVAPGVVLVGAHPLKGVQYRPTMQWFQKPRRVPAVTGALLLIRQTVFEEVGGFDEELPCAYQDVDLCLKLVESGYTNHTLAPLVAIHHESATRSVRVDRNEAEYMYGKWSAVLRIHSGLPKRFSRWSEHPCLRFIEPLSFPWRWLYW